MPTLTGTLGEEALAVQLASRRPQAPAPARTLDLARTSTVTVTHGRTSAEDQPDASTCQVTCYTDALAGLPATGDGLTVTLGASAAAYLGLAGSAWAAAAPRFSGTVTDVRAAPAATGVSGPGILQVTATGPQARLGRLVVGDVPWPSELDGARAARVIAAAQAASGGAFTVGALDPGTVSVLGRDVDAQDALGLLQQLAQDAGAVFYARRDGTLEWHDAEHRRNVTTGAVALTAANVLRNAAWQQSVAGVVNDLTLAYGPDPGTGQPTARQADAGSVATYGPVASSVSTQLLGAADAAARAADMLGRRSQPRWRIDAMSVDMLRTVPPETAALLAQAELGTLATVTGFPESGPFVASRLYVEGWQETFSRGAWVMELAVTDYALSGPAPRWADVPNSWTWANVPADLTWLASAGWWPGQDTAGRWLDVPSDVSWAEAPNAVTWAAADTLWPIT